MKSNRFMAFAMAAAVLLGIAAPCAFADGTYIYVRNAADMKELAEKCVIDSYSVGKTVVIDADIDLSTADFTFIPFFSGTFEGGGHKITGFTLKATNPERGFIGTVGDSGVIKDVKLSGKLTEGEKKEKSGTKVNTEKLLDIIDDISGEAGAVVDRFITDTGVYNIGGIAGVNKGSITGCSFEGSAELDKNVGGIAGVNEGRIEGCTNMASVKGDENIGGIAGKNNGVIKWCTNTGRINDNAVEGMYSTGGIAGMSDGVIEACINEGVIGYKNTGSATGGICGAQSGHISECRNRGAVYGKKRVGGIAGNFEPYTNITYNPDEISERIDEEKEKIRKDLDNIQDRIDGNRQNIKDDLDDFDNRLKDVLGINDITDAISDANDNFSVLTDSLTDLNDTVNSKIANGNSLESIADSIARAEGDLSTSSDEVRDFLVEARNTAKTMSDTTAELSDSFRSSNDELSELLGTVNDDMSDGERRDKIYDTLDGLNEALDSTAKAMDNISTMKVPTIRVDMLEDTDTQLGRILKKVNENSDGLLDPYIKINKWFSEIITDVSERKSKLEELKKALEDELGNLLPTIRPVATALPVVTADPESAMNSFFTIAHAAEDKDKTTLDRLLDLDIHDVDIPLEREVCGEKYEMAVVKYSVNEASVAGSSDVGGISGGVGFGVSAGGSFSNINSDGKEFSLNPSTAIKSVISACINEGDVLAKNTSAGGITGFSDLGKIKDSINSGNIVVTDGSYAGGISGYNLNEIMRCINTGDTDAESDIGGIAGYGKNISETYSLSRTSSDGERRGAIAGTVSGKVEHNYFLKEKLGGINGVDYSDRAQSVKKEALAVDGEISPELAGLEERYWTGSSGDLYMPQLRAFTENTAKSIPDVLKAKSSAHALFRFTVSFIVNDEPIKMMKLDYGEKIPSSDVPEIPKQNGQYGVWDKDVKAEIIRNTKFTAVYNKSKTTLSYGGEPPQILVEGDFDPSAELIVEEFNPDAVIADKKYTATAGYALMVMQNDEKYDGEMKVRVRLPKNNRRMRVGLITENSVVIAESEIDGSYMIFDPNGAERFVLVRAKRSLMPYIIMIMFMLFVAGVVYLLRNRIKERRLLNALKGVAEKLNTPPALAETNEALSENEQEETVQEEIIRDGKETQ
ncbi:MAG: hypothetical protein IJH37_09580 [Clostridia bacterium]|nr:hypothetical protein [Clostridia bacterium]